MKTIQIFLIESFLSFWLSLIIVLHLCVCDTDAYVLASWHQIEVINLVITPPLLSYEWSHSLGHCQQYVLQITYCCLGKDLSSVVFRVLQVLPRLTSIYIWFCRKIFQPLVHGKYPVFLKPMIPQNFWLFWLWANLLRMVSLVLQTADCGDLDFLLLS